MKKIISIFLGVMFMLVPLTAATPASAATFTLGNDATLRPITDTYVNFTIIDTNNSATENGEILSFDYYASNLNPFRFVVVDSINKVTWVSDEIVPGTVGVNTFILATPVLISVGDNIGMYFAQSGTIPFEYVGDPAVYTPNNNGLPIVGSTLSVEGVSGRTYSLVANADTLNCSVVTLVSGTDTQFKNLTLSDPGVSSDDSLFTLGTPGASVLTGPDGYSGAWDAAAADPDVAGAIWVNNTATAPTPGGGGDGQDGSVNVWRLFSHAFTIPTSAVISSSMLHVAADNSVGAFLDNSFVGSAPGFLAVNDITLSPNPGLHELEFVVKNDAYGAINPTGLLYKAVVNYCVPPTPLSCPAAPSIAAKYLKSLGVKPGSSTEKNIISLVARFMGPQKNFGGVGACDSAYGAKVTSFVDNLPH